MMPSFYETNVKYVMFLTKPALKMPCFDEMTESMRVLRAMLQPALTMLCSVKTTLMTPREGTTQTAVLSGVFTRFQIRHGQWRLQHQKNLIPAFILPILRWKTASIKLGQI